MKNTIENSLKKSVSYKEYRKVVADLLTEGKSTGENQTDDLLNYSKLNNSRMKRLDKTFNLSENSKEILENSTKKYSWIVLTESWCGDAAHALPVINKIVEASDNIELKIVLRDENEALMDKFLTNGNKSIPKLIAIDTNTKEVVNSWGPRPSKATKMVQEQKEKYGTLDDNFKEELQVWYNADKGINIEEDILKLLCVTVDCV
ncbi:MAG: thioredoxin family protein [Flavobacteriaceae bacterium]|nr:thioredoxin family protein [Flavobacteriaceae bacterium]